MENNVYTPELTQEELQKVVSAAYDSVNIVNELKVKESLTEYEQDTLSRNEEHIRVMMSKTWFVDALTNEQVVELQAI
jgi:hypothetical protein